MTTEQNKDIVCRFYKAMEANDYNTLKEILAPDLKVYMQSATTPQNREAHLQGMGMWDAAFSNEQFTIEDQIAEGDRVVTRVILRATHSGSGFQGLPPTGKQIALRGTSTECIQNGKIVERWVTSDWLGLMQQLGVIPSPQSSR